MITRGLFRSSLIIILFMGTGVSFTNGQVKEDGPVARSAIYIELAGQGLLYSVNYEYLLADDISVRIGYSQWTISSLFLFTAGELSFTGFPVMVNYLSGSGSGHLELGLGVMPMKISLDGHDILFGTDVSNSATLLIGTATLGYRYQPPDGGFVFRIGLTPFFNEKVIAVSGGLSMGVAF